MVICYDMAENHHGNNQMIIGTLFHKSFLENKEYFLNDGPSSGEWRMTIFPAWENTMDL